MEKLFSEKNIRLFAISAIIIGLITVLLVALFIVILNYQQWRELGNITKIGPLGDSFNGITAPVLMFLMAVLTFLAFYVQFEFNKQQLRFNSSQIINSSFFELFKLHVDTTRTLSITYQGWKTSMNFSEPDISLTEGRTYSGKDYFSVLRYYLWDAAYEKGYPYYLPTAVGRDLPVPNQNPHGSLLVVVKLYYEVVYSQNDNALGYYFRNLYNIFKYIANTDLDEKQKDTYFDLIRAQLSEDELFILHYNLEHEYGAKFKSVLGSYDILKHIDKRQFIENKTYEVAEYPATPRNRGLGDIFAG